MTAIPDPSAPATRWIPTLDGKTVAGNDANPLRFAFAGKIKEREMFAVPNVGTTYHAAYAGGSGAISDSTGPWTMPRPYRTIQAALTNGGTDCDLTITGTDPNGAAQSEVIALVNNTTVQGVKCWKTIISVVSSADPGSSKSITISWGNGWALRGPYDSDSGIVLSCGGVTETPATGTTASTGVVIPATAPNGTRVFCVDYVRAFGLTG